MTAVTRRDMGRLALGGAALAALGTSARAQAVTITVNGSGGSLAKSLERIYEKPFTAETGVGVRATAPVSLAKLKAMVETGNMEWDLTEMGGADMIEAVKNNWLTEVDWSIVDCPSSDDLRLFRRLRNGGSGSSGFEVMRPAAGAASVCAGLSGA